MIYRERWGDCPKSRADPGKIIGHPVRVVGSGI
jgi:hypothetical protein